MVESSTAGATLQIPPSKGLKISSNENSNKVQLDVSAAPESKVQIQPISNAGSGKGLKLDIQA